MPLNEDWIDGGRAENKSAQEGFFVQNGQSLERDPTSPRLSQNAYI